MEELLAVKLRPKSLEDIIGQEHLVGKDNVIYNLVKNKKLFSMILYGHPGIGKTSIATAISNELDVRYRCLNAVVNNKKDFDIVIEEAKDLTTNDIRKGIDKAVSSNYLEGLTIDDDAKEYIAILAGSDLRFAYNLLEVAYYSAHDRHITISVVKKI